MGAVAANGCIVVGLAGTLNCVVDSGSKVVSGTLTPGPGAGGALAFTAFFLLCGVLLQIEAGIAGAEPCRAAVSRRRADTRRRRERARCGRLILRHVARAAKFWRLRRIAQRRRLQQRGIGIGNRGRQHAARRRQHAGIGNLLWWRRLRPARDRRQGRGRHSGSDQGPANNTLPAPNRAPARSVTSEAAKPTYLRRQRAKRQPPGRRMAAEG